VDTEAETETGELKTGHWTLETGDWGLAVVRWLSGQRHISREMRS